MQSSQDAIDDSSDVPDDSPPRSKTAFDATTPLVDERTESGGKSKGIDVDEHNVAGGEQAGQENVPAVPAGVGDSYDTGDLRRADEVYQERLIDSGSYDRHHKQDVTVMVDGRWELRFAPRCRLHHLLEAIITRAQQEDFPYPYSLLLHHLDRFTRSHREHEGEPLSLSVCVKTKSKTEVLLNDYNTMGALPTIRGVVHIVCRPAEGVEETGGAVDAGKAKQMTPKPAERHIMAQTAEDSAAAAAAAVPLAKQPVDVAKVGGAASGPAAAIPLKGAPLPVRETAEPQHIMHKSPSPPSLSPPQPPHQRPFRPAMPLYAPAPAMMPGVGHYPPAAAAARPPAASGFVYAPAPYPMRPPYGYPHHQHHYQHGHWRG
ncbi:unnamed protein product [Vitrella brassicaformis CCMP3155]|uniref:Uncharacterized protein n=2 Tax=Vitrella brassicaformis TaxID=1169539 RepID=A0A0G4FMF5_VITBC|nr:unnamed protein product [Vitrella brassicaformis CCMP3155]|eukprot:CEM14750.1 unnamed protein product [Vitrella brassicaformis CCMP3155]